MEVNIRGRINKKYIESAVERASALLKPPKKVKFFVLDNVKYCPFTVADLSGAVKRDFEKFCRVEKTSMSLTFKEHNHIIVYIGRQDAYLRTNKDALIGTLLHEIMHTVQRRAGLDTLIEKDVRVAFNKFKKKLAALKYPKKQLVKFYRILVDEGSYALKDIFAMSELIKRKLVKFLLEDYYNLYIRKCPKPKFYGKRKKTLGELALALDFELSLMAVNVPFARSRKAKRLLKHLERCYEVNIPEVVAALAPLKKLSKNIRWSQSFRRKFFERLFEASYNLLLGF